jgi:glycerol-3-phosphate dehydrogenase (NAD(P)+)
VGKFAVVGATSWGLTLAWLLQRNGHDVTVITRTETEAQDVRNKHGIARLPELRLPDAVAVHAPPCKDEFDGIVAAMPAQYVRTTISTLGSGASLPILSAAKGIELGTGFMMADVLAELGWERSRVAAISGPNLSHEIARGLPAAAVVASESEAVARRWQEAFSGSMFRVYTTGDLAGVELAGAYKNVLAIAAGIAWGLGFGANTVAALMTRGLAEMSRLGVALGADELTFQGLAGLGDLAATCFSPLSRNRRFGELLAQGSGVASAREAIGEAVEGVATATVALEVAARHGVELPICAEVAAVVEGRKTVPEAIAGLLARPLRAEASNPG